MKSCSFSTLEQCKATSAGRGGDCFRDPFLAKASDAYAYQPKRAVSANAAHRAAKPAAAQ